MSCVQVIGSTSRAKPLGCTSEPIARLLQYLPNRVMGSDMTDGSPSVALRFEILGPVRAYRDGQPVDLGSRLQQAVLAILLLRTGKPVPIERLVSALWDGDPPPNGIDVVQRCIGGLRKALDPERTSLLSLTDGGYVLRVD